MKRYPFVIGATVAGIAGVLSFHTRGAPGAFAAGAPASPSTTPSTAGPSPAGASGTSTVTGKLEQYGYGQLSVRVTMSGGRITKAAVARLQTADTYSQQLASQAIPVLKREVLSAQSARISTLTGATYTSEAYAYSVQSALDKIRK